MYSDMTGPDCPIFYPGVQHRGDITRLRERRIAREVATLVASATRIQNEHPPAAWVMAEAWRMRDQAQRLSPVVEAMYKGGDPDTLMMVAGLLAAWRRALRDDKRCEYVIQMLDAVLQKMTAPPFYLVLSLVDQAIVFHYWMHAINHGVMPPRPGPYPTK